MQALIELIGVKRHFGGVRAVDGIDLRIDPGQVFGLIGPNGSGKSTAIHLISGAHSCTSGQVRMDGADIGHLPAYRRARLGILRTFQSVRLFGNLTVRENLVVARHSHSWLGFSRQKTSRGARVESDELLASFGLLHQSERLAGNLSFGEQRRLEMARALMARPRLLLLDEPAAGLALDEIQQLGDTLLELRRQGVTIVLVEHVLELVMRVADRMAVLHLGRKIAEGTPAEVRANPDVRQAYLGPGL